MASHLAPKSTPKGAPPPTSQPRGRLGAIAELLLPKSLKHGTDRTQLRLAVLLPIAIALGGWTAGGLMIARGALWAGIVAASAGTVGLLTSALPRLTQSLPLTTHVQLLFFSTTFAVVSTMNGGIGTAYVYGCLLIPLTAGGAGEARDWGVTAPGNRRTARRCPSHFGAAG